MNLRNLCKRKKFLRFSVLNPLVGYDLFKVTIQWLSPPLAESKQRRKTRQDFLFLFEHLSISIIPLYLWMTSRKSSQIQQISFHFSHMHLVGRSNPQNLNNIPRLSNKHLASKQDLKSELLRSKLQNPNHKKPEWFEYFGVGYSTVNTGYKCYRGWNKQQKLASVLHHKEESLYETVVTVEPPEWCCDTGGERSLLTLSPKVTASLSTL